MIFVNVFHECAKEYGIVELPLTTPKKLKDKFFILYMRTCENLYDRSQGSHAGISCLLHFRWLK